VKGYESYAAREASATAVLAEAAHGVPADGKPKSISGYHASNLMIGTPEEVYTKIEAAQEACSFCEITIVPQFGVMPHEEALASARLFAEEVLPALHRMDAPLHAAALPAGA
jgi:hypothetical protein